jgi:hypothetical protein
MLQATGHVDAVAGLWVLTHTEAVARSTCVASQRGRSRWPFGSEEPDHLQQSMPTTRPGAWRRGTSGQVVVNVVVNATDAMPAGVLRVLLGCQDAGRRSDTRTAARGLRLSISRSSALLHDEGRWRGHEVGLAVMQGIVLDHGGHVDIDSSPARGEVRVTCRCGRSNSRT